MEDTLAINKIPGGIHFEYSYKKKYNISSINNTDIRIRIPDKQQDNNFQSEYVLYNIEIGDIVEEVGSFDVYVDYYEYKGHKFKLKPGMHNARISSTGNAILFSNIIDKNEHIYMCDGTYFGMIERKKLHKCIGNAFKFEFRGTYSILYSDPRNEIVAMYDHINKNMHLITDEHTTNPEFEWIIFKYVKTFEIDGCRQDLYIYIEIDESWELDDITTDVELDSNKCSLITIMHDNPSEFKIEKDIYRFGPHDFNYFITQLDNTSPDITSPDNASPDNTPVLVVVGKYHVEIRAITSGLPLIKSFSLKYMMDIYSYDNDEDYYFRNSQDFIPFMKLFPWNRRFIEVNNGKLYYKKRDGLIVQCKDKTNEAELAKFKTYEPEYMAIDLNKIDESGKYIPIPLFDLISDEHQELLFKHYSDQPIIELRILENRYLLEFPDNKFIIVDMR
jgi:hypothetical protein